MTIYFFMLDSVYRPGRGGGALVGAAGRGDPGGSGGE